MNTIRNPKIVLALVVFFLHATGSVLSAQVSQGIHVPPAAVFPQIRPWVVGQTATLSSKVYLDNKLAQENTYLLSIVGSETIKGDTFYWLESEYRSNTRTVFIMKMLLPQQTPADILGILNGDLASIVPQRLVYLAGGGRALEVNVPRKTAASVKDLTRERDFFRNHYGHLENQRVSVPAGTFNAIQFFLKRPVVGEDGKTAMTKHVFWQDQQVPIVGTVKSERWSEFPVDNKKKKIFKKEVTSLTSHGETGAFSKILGTPVLLGGKHQEALMKSIFGTPEKENDDDHPGGNSHEGHKDKKND